MVLQYFFFELIDFFILVSACIYTIKKYLLPNSKKNYQEEEEKKIFLQREKKVLNKELNKEETLLCQDKLDINTLKKKITLWKESVHKDTVDEHNKKNELLLFIKNKSYKQTQNYIKEKEKNKVALLAIDEVYNELLNSYSAEKKKKWTDTMLDKVTLEQQ